LAVGEHFAVGDRLSAFGQRLVFWSGERMHIEIPLSALAKNKPKMLSSRLQGGISWSRVKRSVKRIWKDSYRGMDLSMPLRPFENPALAAAILISRSRSAKAVLSG
jgi:hypothetical protein